MERSPLLNLEQAERIDFRELVASSEQSVMESQGATLNEYSAPSRIRIPRNAWGSVKYSSFVSAANWVLVSLPEHEVTAIYVVGIESTPRISGSRPASPVVAQNPQEVVGVEPVFAWSPYASSAESKVLRGLVEQNRPEVADRLNDLIEKYAKDPEVGRLNFSSFRSVAEFFKQNKKLRPNIVAGWDGFLTVEWRLPLVGKPSKDQLSDGILTLEFLPNGDIEYLGFIRATHDRDKIEYDGVAGKDKIIEKISSFLQRM